MKNKDQKKKSSLLRTLLIILAIIVVLVAAAIYYYISTINSMVVYKPIIYLYPTDETEVSVTLGYEDEITVSYPKYTSGWTVLAQPDSSLVDLSSGRNLYALYYESNAMYRFSVQKDGFVVEKENIVEFLEEKLAILGLNDYEAEEFIIYWLPILQQYEYTYIRFATADEILANMPLDMVPAPDTLIRVLMTYKGLDNPIDITPQNLITPERTGFTAVEWGGTEIQ